ncbi:MAG TPA: hypothetical protein VE641_21060 [Chthoniobacterales bacterium]|nr:hypothetical protein [Chthoniobacterales bacterium]
MLLSKDRVDLQFSTTTGIMNTASKHDWRLRAATLNDIDGLHALGANPLVYRYLYDGVPPNKGFIARAVAQSVANAGNTGLGMWSLEDVSTRYAGCVELRPYPSPDQQNSSTC